MKYEREKSSRYGDFVRITFENEEEYQDMIEKYESRIETLKKEECDTYSEEAVVANFKRMKRISDDGTITTTFFGNNCLDLLSTATSCIYSNFYLEKLVSDYKEYVAILKETNKTLKETDEISKTIIQSYHEMTRENITSLFSLMEPLISLAKDEEFVKIMDEFKKETEESK